MSMKTKETEPFFNASSRISGDNFKSSNAISSGIFSMVTDRMFTIQSRQIIFHKKLVYVKD